MPRVASKAVAATQNTCPVSGREGANIEANDKENQMKLSANQTKFLASYAESGNVRLAAGLAEVHRSSHYKWLADDAYRAAFEQAQRESSQVLEEEARRRAAEGWEEPIFQNGKLVGHKRRYSDALLIFLLKGNNPGKFGDRVEQTHRGNAVVTLPNNTRELVKEALKNREFVEFLRQKDLITDSGQSPGSATPSAEPGSEAE